METADTNRVNVAAILQICRDIEMCCAQIYHVYADRFADDQELGALWRKTAAEEENHARQFTLAISIKRDNIIVATNLDILKATQVFNVVKSIHAGILETLPSKMDALRAAINLEKNLAKYHLETVADFEDESLKKMFHAMMQADRGHLQTLEMAYDARLKAEKPA